MRTSRLRRRRRPRPRRVRRPPPAPPPPAEPEKEKKKEPFAFADFTWLNGNSREVDLPLDTPAFTGAFMTDVNYTYSLHHPKDHSLVGSTTTGRTNEFQFDPPRRRRRLPLEEHPRPNDDPVRPVLDDDGAQRREPVAWPVGPRQRLPVPDRSVRRLPRRRARRGQHRRRDLHVVRRALQLLRLRKLGRTRRPTCRRTRRGSSTGSGVQVFTSDKLKIEPWIINGWQSYGMFNEQPGLGMQILWRPTGAVSVLSNSYFGSRRRSTTRAGSAFTATTASRSSTSTTRRLRSRKGAFSLTMDAGCENGGGVSCAGGTDPTQSSSSSGSCSTTACGSTTTSSGSRSAAAR